MKEFSRPVVSKGKRFLLRVEISHEPADYEKYERLRNEIWDFPDDHLSGTRNMMCENYFHEGGSLFLGAFAEDGRGSFPADFEHLAGFSYGFVGVRDKTLGFREPSNLRFYSQFTGVRDAFQSYGLGIRLKEFQKEMLLEIFGIACVICTYDPLTAVNAYRNVHHFGMDVVEYRRATYGAYGGRLNRTDIPTDRFLMSWDLARTPPRPKAPPGASPDSGPEVLKVEKRIVQGRSGVLELETAAEVDLSVDAPRFRVRIPCDFYRMLRETDTDDPVVRRIPLEWRLMTREAFTNLFARGFRVADFIRPSRPEGGFYLLEKSADAE
jgi:predicted GNAT superfamily acetyltransferase